MISLRLELLTGRYVASAFNDRRRAEWPPHPARVFSALVAAHHEGGPTPAQRAALQWLQAQPPPHLHCSPGADARCLKIHYVPVNDQALSDAATVQNAWAKVLAPGGTPKKQQKAEAGLRVAYGKVMAPDKTLSKSFVAAVRHVLPASRTRQPRSFPSVTPEDPVIWMTWSAEPDEAIRAGLEAVARQLVRVGHSSSLVAARWTTEAPAATWVPDEAGGCALRWVGPGQLEALESLHAQGAGAEQRVMPYRVARYRRARVAGQRSSSGFCSQLIVLRRVDGPRVPLWATEAVADAVRRALMSHAPAPMPAILSGHGPEGGPLAGDHVAVVPLPFVGHRHASGDLLGVALVVPEGLGPAPRQSLYRAIAGWEQAHAAGSSEPRATLVLGSLGRWELERLLDPPALVNLRDDTWVRDSTTWASVTPMVLDRHPGCLHAGRSSQRARAVARAQATITAACGRVGLPTPAEIEWGLNPWMNGSEPVARFMRRRGTDDRRPLLHVRLRFAHPVGGPVLLGAGRYRGLGLFRPVDQGAR